MTQEFVEEAEKDEQLKAATAAFQAKAPKAEEDGAALALLGWRRAAYRRRAAYSMSTRELHSSVETRRTFVAGEPSS